MAGLGSYSPGTIPGPTVLDEAPPNPVTGGNTAQANTGVPLGALGVAPLPMAANQLPPEVLTGILQGGESISKMIDSFAQVTPDLAQYALAAKDAILRYMAEVMRAGAGPTSPVNAGPQFPGGGIDRGGGPPSLG